MNSQGKPVLRLGRTQSLKLPSLDRQFSHLSTRSSHSDPPPRPPIIQSPPWNPVYNPVSGRSKFDDHLLHHQKANYDCYYCKKKYYVQEQGSPSVNIPAHDNSTFKTYQQKKHEVQHADCPECQSLAIPTIKMMESTLPRSNRERRSELPQRSLGTGNHVPKFQNDLVVDLDFIRYRKSDEPPSQEIIRLQNYSNYQSVCLAQDIDDVAQDVIRTRSHLTSLHGEVDQVQQDQERIKADLKAVLEKLEIIEEAVKNTRAAFHEESEPVSPASEAIDATFSFFGSPPTDKVEKHLTLKQLASVCTNSNLVRIVEVCQLIKEKLILVNQQTSQLAKRITKARSNNCLAIVTYAPPPPSFTLNEGGGGA